VWRWERERGGKEDGPVPRDGPDGEGLGYGGRKRAERSRPAAWCCPWAGKKRRESWAGNGERREGKVEGFVVFFLLKPFFETFSNFKFKHFFNFSNFKTFQSFTPTNKNTMHSNYDARALIASKLLK
jgi:hypothetical protein